MSDMDSVELRPAHAWDCLSCGKENFCSAIRAELTPAERAEMRRQFDLDDGEDGDFVTSPPEVTCSRCGKTFDVDRSDNLPDDFDPHVEFGSSA